MLVTQDPRRKSFHFGADEVFTAAALRSEPESYLLIDILSAEQVEVGHGAADPLPTLRDGQRTMGLLMLAERATDRHKAVAQKPVAQAAGPAPG